MNTELRMNLDARLSRALTLLAIILAPMTSNAHDDALQALDGVWIYVEDRSEDLALELQGPPMSPKFTLRVEEDAVVYPRPRGDERITLDGSVIEKKESSDSIARYRGEWKQNDGWLEYTLEREGLTDNDLFVLKRVFRITEDGLLVYVFSNKSPKKVALYRHPEDVVLPQPAEATITDLAWLAGAWTGIRGTASIEERWSPPKGGAMLGISRTVKKDKMVAFEYLRIVERDGGLVYIPQPAGGNPTDFVLTEYSETHAAFDNPLHAYPTRIKYELSEDGELIASVGLIKGGSPRQFKFNREDE